MPLKIKEWECRYCGTRYPKGREGKQLARACEYLGKPEKLVKKGQIFKGNESQGIMASHVGINTVINVSIVRRLRNRKKNRYEHVVIVSFQNENGSTGNWTQEGFIKRQQSGAIELI